MEDSIDHNHLKMVMACLIGVPDSIRDDLVNHREPKKPKNKDRDCGSRRGKDHWCHYM